MAARLGDVIYWAMCGVAGLALALLAFVVLNPGSEAVPWGVFFGGVAIVAWLFGRAVRYELSLGAVTSSGRRSSIIR